MNKWSPLLLSVLRIVAGLLFVEHGAQKILDFPPAPPHEGAAHAMSPLMAHLAPVSGYIELIGGALLLIGLFTRVVAFICSGEMAVAYFTAHAPGGLYPINNHGELAVLYCFVFLYLFAAGGGPISLDASVRKKP
jgi:putative oxidoreductase